MPVVELSEVETIDLLTVALRSVIVALSVSRPAPGR